MIKKGQKIFFINQLLKAQTKTAKPSQWKRKQVLKVEKCDVCNRTFSNQQGVNLHKKKIHGNTLILKEKRKVVGNQLKVISDLIKSESVGEGSRSSSPSPKRLNAEGKEENKENNQTKKEEEMEQSGGSSEKARDKKEDIGVQCNIETNLSDLEQDLFSSKAGNY